MDPFSTRAEGDVHLRGKSIWLGVMNVKTKAILIGCDKGCLPLKNIFDLRGIPRVRYFARRTVVPLCHCAPHPRRIFDI